MHIRPGILRGEIFFAPHPTCSGPILAKILRFVKSRPHVFLNSRLRLALILHNPTMISKTAHFSIFRFLPGKKVFDLKTT